MRYVIIDSHRNLTKKRREDMRAFFCEVKRITPKEGEKQVDFCDWYEKEYAVSWFEVLAYDARQLVGYLRCLRNPIDVRQWYIGDVHVIKSHWQQGIASGLYGKTMRELQKYEAAENVISAVRRDNVKSIGLHKKMGFSDTGEPCNFADFYQDENETKYLKWLFFQAPLPEECGDAGTLLLPLWKQYEKERFPEKKATGASKRLCELLERIKAEKREFETIWCGNRLVGFQYDDGNQVITYHLQETESGK